MVFLDRYGAGEGVRRPLLCTYRLAEAGRLIERLCRKEGVEVVGLEPLSKDAVTGMIHDILAMESPPARLVRYLQSQSRGSPLVVTEYLNAMLASGVLVRDFAGGWQVEGADTLDRIEIPIGLRDLLIERVGTVPQAEMDLLKAAAVYGSPFDERILSLMTKSEGGSVASGVADLIALRVLQETPSGGLRFVHRQMEDLIVDRLAGEEAVRLHRRAASDLERALDPGQAHELRRFARHLELSGERDRACAAYCRAAGMAKEGYALEEQIHLLRSYLRLAASESEEALAARVALGNLYLQVHGDTQAALAELEFAKGMASRIGDERLIPGITDSQGLCYWMAGALDKAQALFEEALDWLRKRGVEGKRATILGHLAIVHHQLGDLERAEEAYRAAIRASTREDRRVKASINLVHLASLHREQGRSELAYREYREALAVQRDVGNPRSQAECLINIGELHLDAGRFAKARAAADYALSVYRHEANRRGELYARRLLSKVAIAGSRMDQARSLLQQVLHGARLIGDRDLEISAIVDLAVIGRSAADAASARTLLVMASRRLDDITSGAARPSLLLALSLLHGQVGNGAESIYYGRLARRRSAVLPFGYRRAFHLYGLARYGLLPNGEAVECLEEALSILSDAGMSGSKLAADAEAERARLARLDESEGESA